MRAFAGDKLARRASAGTSASRRAGRRRHRRRGRSGSAPASFRRAAARWKCRPRTVPPLAVSRMIDLDDACAAQRSSAQFGFAKQAGEGTALVRRSASFRRRKTPRKRRSGTIFMRPPAAGSRALGIGDSIRQLRPAVRSVASRGNRRYHRAVARSASSRSQTGCQPRCREPCVLSSAQQARFVRASCVAACPGDVRANERSASIEQLRDGAASLRAGPKFHAPANSRSGHQADWRPAQVAGQRLEHVLPRARGVG